MKKQEERLCLSSTKLAQFRDNSICALSDIEKLKLQTDYTRVSLGNIFMTVSQGRIIIDGDQI